MTVSYASYELQDGYINHWLTAGPQAIPLDDEMRNVPASAREDLAQRFYDSNSGIHKQPVEPGPLEEAAFKIGSYQGEWSYIGCREDHFVDHSAAYPGYQYLRAWAYTRLVCTAAQTAEFTLTVFGPAEVWINQVSAARVTAFADRGADLVFHAELKEGENEILVRFEGAALPTCTLAVSLRLAAKGAGLRIPTLIPALERRAQLEAVNRQVYLNQDVYAAEDHLSIHWPASIEKPTFQDVRLQTPTGRIYAQSEDVGIPGQPVFLNSPMGLNPGPYQAFVMPRAWEMYDSNIRVFTTLPCWVMGRNRFSDRPYGSFEERRREALQMVAARREGLSAEIARMALGQWDELDNGVLTQAIAGISQRPAGSDEQMLGLLAALGRFGSRPEFPRWIKNEIKACALGYPYGSRQASSEADEIIALACQILAGQIYPEQTFAAGQTGKQLRTQAEDQALAWMQAHGEGGFAAWDSDQVYAASLMTLAYLADLAQSEAVYELASVLMDKMFFSLALNSFKGVFGSSRAVAHTWGVRSALLEATAGISRLMWGMGVFNQHLAAVLSLACMTKYELPPILSDIASAQPVELWNLGQQALGEERVNQVTYRTPDAMLASAQDYRPGQPGSREHIWQATFAPQCQVFVTHPGCSSLVDAHAPNFWLGNGVLPRVAQWKDTLIALYDLPDHARMGFTHAYFPTSSFDEYALQGEWAFARKGEGYLALFSSGGLELVSEGRTALRELRSSGRQNVWLCQVGRAAIDGDFAAFQQKVLGQALKVDGLSVEVQTLRGDALAFNWSGAFLRNGEEQTLSGFAHFDNAFTTVEYPCRQMEIKTDDYLLRLDFSDSL